MIAYDSRGLSYRTPFSVMLILLPILGCATAAKVEHNSAEIENLIEQARASMVRPRIYWTGVDPEYMELAEEFGGLSEEEKQILCAGNKALPLLKREAEDTTSPWRARAIRIIGLIGEESSAQFLKQLVINDASPCVRREALKALGFLGDHGNIDFVRSLFATGKVDAMSLLWTLAKHGDEMAFEEYIEWTNCMARLPRVILMISPENERNEKGKLDIRWDTESTSPTVFRNLLDLSELGNKKAVEVIIEHLNNDDVSVVKAANFILNRLTGQAYSLKWRTEPPYQFWSRWWKKNSDNLKWSEVNRRFETQK